MKGYTEWVSRNPELRVGFVTNCFKRILYINADWPNGRYTKFNGEKVMKGILKDDCDKAREFTEAELLLELL